MRFRCRKTPELLAVYVQSGGASPTLQSRTVTPSSSQQTIYPQSGYDALSSVVVNGDSNLVSSNIKLGVSIFGVNGQLTGDKFFWFSDEQSNFTLSNKKISISGLNAFSGYNFMTFSYYCRDYRYTTNSIVSCFITNQYGSTWFGYYGLSYSDAVAIKGASNNYPFTGTISDSLIEVEIASSASYFFQAPSTSNGLVWITLFN